MKHGIRHLFAVAVAMTGMVAGSACGHSPGNPGLTQKDFSSRQTRVPGEYLVTLDEQANVKAISDLYGRFGIKGIQDLGGNIFLVTLSEDPGPDNMEELRRRDARIKAVQPNFVYRTNGPRNPP